MEKLRLYIQIHQLKEQGFKIAAIARKLEISRNTVYKFLGMSFEEATDWVVSLGRRRRKLDRYQDHIVYWLREHPDLSAAQIEDWLREQYPTIQVGSSTVRSYVRDLRDLYHLSKEELPRMYSATDELPMGQQAQVDWGEITVKNIENKEMKLFFITFVLSHSRYKYVEWLDRPFTTKDTIRCHENAFQYFGGIPKEMVYDQDHLITVSENAGDIILTGDFQAYKQERDFHIYLCRKGDPESKGKVENVVKYVKRNFARHRVFPNLDAWNEKCLAWLVRTGNDHVHHTTKKRPVEVHAVEKQHLQPVSTLLSFESNFNSSITRTVHKDNIIKYQSNRYSLPVGTYRPKGDNVVFIEIQAEELIIRASPQGDLLARHPLCHEKGRLIKNHQHTKDRSKGIQVDKETLIRQFQDQDNATQFIRELGLRYPRYIRDQLHVMQRALTRFRSEIEEALTICIREQLWSANDLRDVAQHLTRLQSSEDVQAPTVLSDTLNQSALKTAVATRQVDTYLEILGGV